MNHTVAPAEVRAQVSTLGTRVVIPNTREPLSVAEFSIDIEGIKELASTRKQERPPETEDVAHIAC